MTKADLVTAIQDKIGLSKNESYDIVEQVFEMIKGGLATGDRVKVAGFGTFEVKEKQVRRGRNPQTGCELMISGRRVLKFKASPVLKKEMNVG